MKVATANKIRKYYIEKLFAFLSAEEEDCGMITSNSFNFPHVEDEEECSVEIVVKVTKEDETYEKREEYAIKLREKAEKAEKAKIAKEKKIERDKKAREKKKEEKKE